jgi:hypothetical protein
MTGKAIVQGLGTRRNENFIEGLLEEISKDNVAGMVKATGYDTSIDKDTYLIAKGITEDIGFFVLGMIGIGPFEHTVVFDVNILS